MSRTLRRSAGFTILELALVLIVVGILAAVFVPMAQVVHENTMNDRDQSSLEVARDALLGYIRVNQGIPCLDASGTQITPDYSVTPPLVCDPTATLDLLGVRSTDARNLTYAYDVNEWLTVDHITNTGPNICQALADIIAQADPTIPPPATPPPLDPQVCDSTNANTGSTACTPTQPHPMAFVLVGRGSDRCLNLENTHASAPNNAVCTTAVASNRTFENPARIHDRTTGAGYYEDMVYEVTPSKLAEELGCPAGGSGGPTFSYCSSGENLVSIINGDSQNKALVIGPNCYLVDARTSGGAGCQPVGSPIAVLDASCTGSVVLSGTVGSLDGGAISDGRTDILCSKIPTTCTSN